MRQEIKAPSMGESISEATVSAILKAAGTRVKMDDEILELATDKVNQVLYAPCAGVFHPTVKEEDVVKIGEIIGYIELSAEAPKEEAPSTKPDQGAPLKPAEGSAREVKSTEGDLQAKAASTMQPAARKGQGDFLKNITEKPLAPPIAVENGKDTQSSAPIAPAGVREERRKMSRIRQVIASRLVEVQHHTAMLTTFNEVDLTALMDIRERNKESFVKEFGVKLGLMSFFVKASVAALQKFPAINSYIDKDEIVERRYYSIGVAVGTDKGVVVPVLKECDRYSFADIERSIADYASKIKEGKISADDLRGAGFTISNGGVYGSLLSTPILSPNQCAILGMHKIQKRPVVVDDQIVVRQMMYLALSYDHRIVDGKEAVSFLVHIKNLLEDPSRILF